MYSDVYLLSERRRFTTLMFNTYVYARFTFTLVLMGYLSHFWERYLYFNSNMTSGLFIKKKKICQHSSLRTMLRWLHCISVPEELSHGSSLIKFCLAKVAKPRNTGNCHDTAWETGPSSRGW